MVKLDYALDKTDKSLKYVDDVPVGRQCDCICPICDEPLIAYNKGLKQAHHFGHFSGVEHTINPMTRIHMLAQIILSKSFRFQLIYNPRNRFLNLDDELSESGLVFGRNNLNSYQEISVSDKYFVDGLTEYTKTTSQGVLRYDVYFQDFNLAVEIYVTHRVNLEKKKKIVDARDWCIEIDLSNINRDISYEDLKAWLDDLIFYDSTFVFGVGPYVEYINGIWKQYDKYLDDVLDVHFSSDIPSSITKRQMLESLFDKYGASRNESELIPEFTINGIEKLYEKLSIINFDISYSMLHRLKIQMIKQPVPHRYGIRNVSLKLRTRNEEGRMVYIKTIRVGWIYMP